MHLKSAVWSFVLDETMAGRTVTLADVRGEFGVVPGSADDDIIHDTLDQMADYGWLRETSDGYAAARPRPTTPQPDAFRQ